MKDTLSKNAVSKDHNDGGPNAETDMQADAAAEVLSDLTGWPLTDCRYAWTKMIEAAIKATSVRP